MTSDSTTTDGLSALRALFFDNAVPLPLGALLGMKPVSVEAGTMRFSLEPTRELYNPLGTVHGGIIATLLDSAMGCAVQSVLGAGDRYTTLEIKVNYVRPVVETTGEVIGEGKVVHEGGRIATAEASVTDSAGRLYAHATTTCLISRARPAQMSA